MLLKITEEQIKEAIASTGFVTAGDPLDEIADAIIEAAEEIEEDDD